MSAEGKILPFKNIDMRIFTICLHKIYQKEYAYNNALHIQTVDTNSSVIHQGQNVYQIWPLEKMEKQIKH